MAYFEKIILALIVDQNERIIASLIADESVWDIWLS